MAESAEPPEDVAELLRRSLRRLRSEVPDSYRHLITALGPLVVEVTIDGEVFVLRADRHELWVGDGAAPGAGTRIRTSLGTVLDVLDARLPMVEAVESGRLAVRGSLDDVLRAHDALIAYMHAAIRAPSAPGLLDALRGAR